MKKGSTTHKTGFEYIITLKKKEDSTWPRLSKDTAKRQNIKVDWNDFVDSEEEDEAEQDTGMPNFDFGGQDGMEGDSDDDEEQPDDAGLDDLEGDADVEETLKEE